jgi:hypothetical protein
MLSLDKTIDLMGKRGRENNNENKKKYLFSISDLIYI